MLLNIDYQTFEIPGGDATIDIKPLEVNAYQKLIRLISDIGIADVKEEAAIAEGLKRLGDEKLLSIIQEIIPDHCQNLKGVEIQENSSKRIASIEDLIKYGASIQFFFPVLLQLFAISTLSAKETDVLKK